MKKTIIVWIVASVLMVALAWHVLVHIDWSVFARISVGMLVLLAASSVAMSMAYAAGAQALLFGMNTRPTYFCVLLAMLAGGTVGLAGDPKIGVPARLFFYKLLSNIPVNIGAAQMAAETVLWLALMGIILAVPTELAGEYAPTLSLVAASAVAVLIFAIIAGPAILVRLPGVGNLYRRWPAVERLIEHTRAAILGLRVSTVGWATFWFLVTYAVDTFSLYLLLDALNAAVRSVLLAQVIVISYLVGLASMLPLGIGVRDITFLALLQQLGVSAEMAAAAVVAQRAMRTVIPLMLGLPALAFVARWRRRTA